MSCLDEENDVNEFELTNWDSELKGRVRLFVLYYCTRDDCFLNGTAAYKKAWTRMKDGETIIPSDKSAAERASRLLKDEKIRKAISKLNKKTQIETDEEAAYKILQQYRILAEYNPSQIIDADGKLRVKNLEELGELAKCIQSIKKRESKQGTFFEVTLIDRLRAMEIYAKYLNLIRPENQNNIDIPIFWLTDKQDVDKYNDQTP